jgi:hypothetical protein
MTNLNDASPTDRAHLLVQLSSDDVRLKYTCVVHNAELIHYRENLLGRVGGADRFLALDRHVDRELNAIRTICHDHHGKIVVLEGLDILISYLRARSAVFAIFFGQRLSQLRQLEASLWVALPPALVPEDWPVSRLEQLD